MTSALANEEAQLCLFFNPDDHPENILKAFQEFIQHFQLCYDALYPDPPKLSLEAVTERWNIMEATPENPSPKSNLEQFDNLCETLKHATKHQSFWEPIHQRDYTRIDVWLHQRSKHGKMHSRKIL